ncbi:MAG: biotin synthase BioB [Bacteroidetes bacterium]|jgi:biotin synthase|nr:MAG: biotin synthase BioB [Bacteroidota bacterium]
MKPLTKNEIKKIYQQPLIELIHQAAEIHRKNFNVKQVQISSLVSIKTGGCPEDCAYCPQSAKYQTEIKVHKLMEPDELKNNIEYAKQNGVSRLCLGAAWREVRNNRDFDKVLEMVRMITNEGLEVCATFGMINEEQAKKLAEAGLYAYNHNIDTSEEYYNKIITTRNYQDRIQTLHNVRKAGLTICSGGIIGMGESEDDRISMLYTLNLLNPHPESVPINTLVPVKGTPLENQPKVSVWELVRMIATTRIVLPKSMVRLSAGRLDLSIEAQALCFIAGANSIFAGDKLLTTPNNDIRQDKLMFELLGLEPLPSIHQRKTEKIEN